MKKRKYYPEVLALAAALTVVSAGIGKTWSYFTTYTEAAGGYTIHLGDRTEVTEEFSGWTKHVTITNDEGSEPVYVRARAFCGNLYSIEYSGEGWSLSSDGYYYYDGIVYGGGSAARLDLRIQGIPTEPKDKENFNVVVIYESVPVKYHEDGTAYTVEETDWSEILDADRTEASGSAEQNTDRADSGNVNGTDGNGETSDGNGEASDSNGEASDNNGEASDSNGEASDGNGEASDSNGEASDGNGETSDGNGEASDNNGENSGNTDSNSNESTNSRSGGVQ